jgi:hypothetical protein
MERAAGKEAMKERRARWRRIFEEAARSELSTRRFCQEYDVDETQFYYWRRVLATEQTTRFVLVRPDRRSRTMIMTMTKWPRSVIESDRTGMPEPFSPFLCPLEYHECLPLASTGSRDFQKRQGRLER